MDWDLNKARQQYELVSTDLELFKEKLSNRLAEKQPHIRSTINTSQQSRKIVIGIAGAVFLLSATGIAAVQYHEIVNQNAAYQLEKAEYRWDEIQNIVDMNSSYGQRLEQIKKSMANGTAMVVYDSYKDDITILRKPLETSDYSSFHQVVNLYFQLPPTLLEDFDFTNGSILFRPESGERYRQELKEQAKTANKQMVVKILALTDEIVKVDAEYQSNQGKIHISASHAGSYDLKETIPADAVVESIRVNDFEAYYLVLRDNEGNEQKRIQYMIKIPGTNRNVKYTVYSDVKTICKKDLVSVVQLLQSL
ncbi:hypothetical protein LOK74_16920 [Brevibacillus humidisoli]|uniref:hypothetical protein n=1 Tax=Brevibacillus humidisoli TaxID=2895522 RepID=UPI001E2D9953|nr:hypothetical protein [Brevibacillus humidisoli]UFJ39725.1 hypothetical protein LOK74_16920 [Brevibacillus humidisoli]